MAERDLAPGGPGAILRGCRCPQVDNHFGLGYMLDSHYFVVREGCPLHWKYPEEKPEDQPQAAPLSEVTDPEAFEPDPEDDPEDGPGPGGEDRRRTPPPESEPSRQPEPDIDF